MVNNRSIYNEYERIDRPIRFGWEAFVSVTILFILTIILVTLQFIIKNHLIRTDISNDRVANQSHINSTNSFNNMVSKTKPWIECQNVIPGIDIINHGVDITKWDLFPHNYSTYQGLRTSIFEFSCDNDNYWAYPNNGKQNRSLPDQIEYIQYIVCDIHNPNTINYYSLEQIKNELATNLHVADQGTFGFLSSSVLYHNLVKAIVESDQTVFVTESCVSKLNLKLNRSNATRFNQKFSKFIKTLGSSKYEDMPQMYDSFVQTFGTHFLEEATIGGSLNLQTAVDNEYFFKNSFKTVVNMVRKQFMSYINQSNIVLDNNFMSYIHNYFTYYGGENIDLNNVQIWIENIKQKPSLLSGKLRPIYDLIDDAKTKREVQKAVKIKLSRSHLNEIKLLLPMISYLSPYEVNKLKNKLNKIENIINQIGASSVDIIEKAINELYNRILYFKGLLNDSFCCYFVYNEFISFIDRSILNKYYIKFKNVSDDIVQCKWGLMRACHFEYNAKFEEENRNDDRFRDEYLRMINGESMPPYDEIRMLMRRTVNYIANQLESKFQICDIHNGQQRMLCRHCVENNVNCWYSKGLACKTERTWELIGYRGEKLNKDQQCHTIIMIPRPNSDEIDKNRQ